VSWTTTWHDLTHLDVPVLEKVLRTLIVYGGLVLLMRLAGKRVLSQLNTFDLVVVLLLSNVVQNAIIGPDDSLVGGLLGAAILLAVNGLVVRLSFANGFVARLFEGTDTVLVENGRDSVETRIMTVTYGIKIDDSVFKSPEA